MTQTYTETYTVQLTDIDENNHMNNVRYVELIQEISKQHWYKLIAGKPYNEMYYWVILNHNIDYRSSALLNDELIVETFVEKIDQLYSYRRVTVKHKSNGKLCMSALTKWCLMSLETRKLCRIPEEFKEIVFGKEV